MARRDDDKALLAPRQDAVPGTDDPMRELTVKLPACWPRSAGARACLCAKGRINPPARLVCTPEARKPPARRPFHMDIGGAVANDLIPHEEKLREYLKAAGLRLKTLVDNDGIYHARAIKK